MNIISIDPSKSSTGIYKTFKGAFQSYCIKNKQKVSQADALKVIADKLVEEFRAVNYTFGMIEGYGINSKNKYSITVIPEIVGVIRLMFRLYDIPLITVPVQTWKRITGIKVDKKKFKGKYLEVVNRKYNMDFSTTDEADAFLIYTTVREICKKTKRLTDSEIKIRTAFADVLKNSPQVKPEAKIENKGDV
jgi:Holliday junction resolvasome RuvABC endonuclease subunit